LKKNLFVVSGVHLPAVQLNVKIKRSEANLKIVLKWKKSKTDTDKTVPPTM